MDKRGVRIQSKVEGDIVSDSNIWEVGGWGVCRAFILKIPLFLLLLFG